MEISRKTRGTRGFTSHPYVYYNTQSQIEDNGCIPSDYSQIFFSHNATSEDIYRISTFWRLTFPGELTSALQDEGITIFDSNPGTSCGWLRLADGYKAGVNTGTIYYQILKQGTTYDPVLLQDALGVLNSHYPSLGIGLAVGIPCGVVGVVLLIFVCLWRWDKRGNAKRQR